MSLAQKVDSAIADHQVTVFSKSWCPHSRAAKQLLSSLDAEDVHIIELDHESNEDEWQDYLQKKTGQRTVPNIFIGHKHIGGNSDLQALNRSGKLTPLLKSHL